MFTRKFLLLALAISVANSTPFQKRAKVCNGRTELCNRSYGEVVTVGAHNSFAVSTNELNFSANQNVDVIRQLDLGVRLLQGSGHLQFGELHLCHTNCALLDGGPLLNYLKVVKSWLDAHPEEVLTLLFTNPNELDVLDWWAPVFKKSGIEDMTFVPPNGPSVDHGAWPKLGELIDTGKRVIVFMDSHHDTNKVPYILPEFQNIWENMYSVTDPTFPCKIDRTEGNTDAHMYMINHSLNYKFLGIDSIIVPDRHKADTTNSVASILANVEGCKGFAGGRKPKFLLLDWVDKGEPFKAADLLNGF